MWVTNSHKEVTKTYLRYDIKSSITNLTQKSNDIHYMIVAIDRAIGGTPSGNDTRLIGNCHQALQELSSAMQTLNNCLESVNQLETREWVDDD